MSSDQTQPVPEWWNQPQGPKKDRGNQWEQDYQGNEETQSSQGTQDLSVGRGDEDSQATQQLPVKQQLPVNQGFPSGQEHPAGRGFPSAQGYQAEQERQARQGYQADRGYPARQGYPAEQGFQQDQDYPGNRGAQEAPPKQGLPGAQGYQGPPPRERRRRRRWPLITLIVIIAVLVIGDRAANAYTEDQMASQVQSSLALSGKPHVTIQGFPFLTQLAARDFRTVDISASNETAGPGGQLEIASLTATLHGMHIHGLNSATVDQFNASALVTFTALANAGGIPQGVTLSPDGANKIKASIDIGPLSESADAQITQTGPGRINIKVLDAGGITSAILGNLNFNVDIPKLPAGVSIKSISVTQQGLRITAAGTNTTLSQ